MADLPENVDLQWIGRTLLTMQDRLMSLEDQLTVLSAIVVRLDRDSSRRDERDSDILNEMRAMVRQHQRFNDRLRALEDERR